MYYKFQALLKYFKAVTGREITPGIIAAIQSFGSKINLHPHLHFLLTEGGEDKQGWFHKVSNFNDALLTKFFSREVFSMLLQEGLINLESGCQWVEIKENWARFYAIPKTKFLSFYISLR